MICSSIDEALFVKPEMEIEEKVDIVKKEEE